MIEELREKAARLPLKPGVYIMKDETGQVIYVGKAKQLKNRVSSYFIGEHNMKTVALVSKITDFDVIMANSEFEALVLENSLIKHHMPKYNILLKDDKGYPFIRLDVNSPYPRFSIVSKTAEDGARYFGPYGSRGTVFSAVDAVCKAMKLPTCSRVFPRDIGKDRPCLNYHMGACRAYCLRDTPQSEYRRAVDDAVMLFEGKISEVVGRLTVDMEEAAEKLRFELAAELRDRIKAVSALKTKQYVLSSSLVDTDAVGFQSDQTRSCFVVLNYMDGKLVDKSMELLEIPSEEDVGEVISVLLRQYYLMRGVTPKNVCIQCEVEDAEELEQFLTENAGHKVSLTVPKRGEKVRLVETALLNAREELERVATSEERVSKTAQWLQKALQLQRIPERIEAFDISNTGSSEIVASMTVFVRGKPLKKAYRKFKIESVEGQNDYGSMTETVGRRLHRYAEGDEKFSPLPDIMLIDGGEQHVCAAVKAMEETGIFVPVFGMVKDDRHRTRALVSPEGEEIGIAAQPSVFAFIGTIQEETHRFAIEYHRSRRSKSVVSSKLDKIPGVGEKRKNDLLKFFRSVKGIAEATTEDLARVVPKNTAKAVYDYFHGESGDESQ